MSEAKESSKKPRPSKPKNDEIAKQLEHLESQLAERTSDLQRTRADFENYRKRVDHEKAAAKETGRASAILQLLPIIDTIERAITVVPADLNQNAWVKGIVGIQKNLEKSLKKLDLIKIEAKPGTVFDPELHQAIQVDEDAKGETEVIDEELQAGYLLHERPIRHAMVKVTRR